ncbi:MAG: class I mannose-6-phosphate isomerase [Candidatus Eremiobacteraeota bacterium]|nr:class I mannose-6-phosphate isomerase [Candidatus Eremiobacteraeota bacterium]
MTDATIYPYILTPKETPAIWGGNALVTRFGKTADPHAKIGESWECWDTNAVRNGCFAGSTVADLRRQLGPALLGNLDADRPFPVLTKIIDARESLSVQVHPDDAYAQRVEHQPNGKTECWYIFSAQDGAELVLGWSRATTREEYERRVADGTLGEILRRVSVAAGDVFYLPAGTLHAIGAGIILFETQQASDLTYRIFDWNRTGPDGKPRELHVDKAADVLDYQAGTAGAVETLAYRFEDLDRVALIADRRFIVERITAGIEPASLATNGRPVIVMALEHPMQVTANETSVTLDPYETALVPAAAQWCTVNAQRDRASFMFVTPPEHREIFIAQLLAAGLQQASVDRFVGQFSGT